MDYTIKMLVLRAQYITIAAESVEEAKQKAIKITPNVCECECIKEVESERKGFKKDNAGHA